MDRVLIVAAAGRGSRLGAVVPKALVPVAGRPMLDHLVAMHRATVDRFLVVIAPDAESEFRAFASTCSAPIDLSLQPEPTGMLDAIWTAAPFVARHRPRRVVITWCDQIAVAQRTIMTLHRQTQAKDAADLVLPTITVDRPYIHFDRDVSGTVTRVRQRREGDVMPERGEADMGLFDLSTDAYVSELPVFMGEVTAAPTTGERNFLPFIPWLASRRRVETFAGAAPMEATGINTPEDLVAVERFLATLQAGPR